MDTRQLLRNLLKQDDDTLLDAILSHGEVRHYKKGDVLFEYGKLPHEIGFQLSGVVALILPNDHGQLIVDCISDCPGMPLMPSSGMDKPASSTFQVLTDTQIFLCPTAFITKLLAESAALQQCFIELLQQSIQYNLEAHRALQNDDPRGRYEWFLSKHPNFPDRGLNKYVAAYLNTTPETISRLRRVMKQAAETTPAR